MGVFMKLIIDQAFYGGPGNTVDVTAAVQKLCDGTTGTAVQIAVLPQTFGIADPLPNVRKSLTVKYQTCNNQGVKSRPLYRSGVDGGTVSIPNAFQVVHAVEAIYSTPTEFYNITAQFNDYLSLNPTVTSVSVGSKDFFNFFTCGSDPAFGIVKSLYLHLRIPSLSEDKFLCANDGETLTWTIG
jgi:hypothetical protein